MGERDSKLGRLLKLFTRWPRKPWLHDWWDPWWCRHGAVVRAEQTEDMPRANKVNAPLKKKHNRTTSPNPSLSPDVAMLHTGCDLFLSPWEM